MTKIIILLAVFIGIYLEFSTSTNLECNFKNLENIDGVTFDYFCIINKDPAIKTKESAQITSISGDHELEKTNTDVVTVNAYGDIINFFPRGLNTFFPNIIKIRLVNCDVKEIHQDDLKPFPKLVELGLSWNLITTLEDGLFDFNPELSEISLFENQIARIGPNVFDNLSKLTTLSLGYNPCINAKAESADEVQSVIQKIKKSECVKA